MKYIHKPIEVEAMKFTRTEAENPDSLAFSQFFIQDRSKTNSWSYWKTPESLTVPGRFFLRTKQHSTMMVAIGDWVVKDSTGYVTLMDDKRFNELYKAKQPPQEDWREVIKTSGLSYEKIKEAYAKVLPRINPMRTVNCENHYGNNCPNCNPRWIEPLPGVTTSMLQEYFAKQDEGPTSAIEAVMIERTAEAARRTMELNERKYLGNKKGEGLNVHRIDSTDRETGPSDCCDRGPCEGCKGDK